MKALICNAGCVWVMVLGTVISTHGQTKPPLSAQLPPGPLLAIPDEAQWQVTVSQEKDPANATNSERTVELIKSVAISDNVRHEETKDASGSKLSIWCRGEDEIYKSSSLNQFFFCPPSDLQHYITNPGKLFPELDWISTSNFIGSKNVNGKPCLVFGDPPSLITQAQSSELLANETVDISYFKKSELSKIAYIEQETRLPIYYQEGAGSYVYQFGPVPRSPLVLPEEITAMIKLRDERIKRLSIQPARS